MEIERKFVLDSVSEDRDLGPGTTIDQGYLAVGETTEVRLRRKGEACLLTVKRGSGLARAEFEISLDRHQFEALWPATAGRRLEKTRHRVRVEGGTAEVDRYGGALAGLTTAEVEFASTEAAEAFEPPSWFGREVTGDERWLNKNLALHGRPQG